MSKERLEIIKKLRETILEENDFRTRCVLAYVFVNLGYMDWLIEQAERLEAIIKHRNDILKANEYLNEQNQRYKQALEEIKNFTPVQDTDSVVEIKGIAEEALK